MAHAGHTVVILALHEGSKVRVRNVATAAEFDVPPSELSGVSRSLSPVEVMQRRELVRQCTRKEWRVARRCERVIRQIIESDEITVDKVAAASKALELSRSSVYRLIRRYREAAQTSSLLLGHRGITQHHLQLSDVRETIVTRAIEERFLRRPHASVSQLTKQIRELCIRAQQKPISRKAIDRRIALLDPRLVTRKRHGAKAAHDAVGPVGGEYNVQEPLAVMQIDHTRVDAIVVDPVTRTPIARPWLTLAIDVATRVVMGMAVTLDAPSIYSVSLAVTHACLPKDAWIVERGLNLTWDTFGMPAALHRDNAKEFRSDAIRRGCDEYGIQRIFRPIATPHFGGHIERLIGTRMGQVHILPGTASSNIAERGDYDAAKSATMTLAEFEKWLALEIAGRYHRDTHRGLGVSPLAAWESGIVKPPKSQLPFNARQFMLHFLPLAIRAFQKDGIHMFNIRYWSDRLPVIARPHDEVVVRYNPSSLSRIYVLGRDGGYHDIVYGDVRHPPISLWEHRFACALLREQNSKVNEIGIFSTLKQQRTNPAHRKSPSTSSSTVCPLPKPHARSPSNRYRNR